MRKFFVCIFLFLVLPKVGLSQSNSIATIEQNLKLSKEFTKKNLDSALHFADKALLLSKKNNNDTLVAQSNIHKSNILILKGNYTASDSLLNTNLKNKLPPHLLGKTWNNLGAIQFQKQNYKNALTIYLKAASIFENSENGNKQDFIADTYRNIGILNAILKNYEKARVYLEKAFASNPKDKDLQLQIASNLCTLYYDLKLFDEFIDKVFKTEKLAINQNSKRVLSILYTNLTNYYTDVEPNYERALDYGKKSVVLKKELNYINSLVYSYNNLGYTSLKNKEYKNAIDYLDSTIQRSGKTISPIVYNNLKDAYLGLNDYKNALHYADLRNQLKDSISKKKQNAKVAELMEKFESEKKQQQIDILDAQNELQALTIKNQKFWFLWSVIFIILAIAIGYFGFHNYRSKQKLDKVLLRQRLLKAQLNPHFLFNALQSIQNFIYKNDKEKSSSYLASYSKLIRLVLENSEEDLIPISEDQLALESYLNLQQLTQNDSFQYSIKVNADVDDDFDRIPPLITQPFVENAVIHGIKNITNGFIEVVYYKEKNALCISISDNGKGFVEDKNQNEKRLHKSMSLNIIKEQFKTLSQTNKNFKGEIDIDGSVGTKVILRITNT